MTWNGGYITEIDYTRGYYREISPSWLRLVALSKGFVPPPARDFRYLELGFGQGVSLALHSAAHAGSYFGTDFLPAHTGQAAAWGAGAGLDLQAFNDSFAQLAQRTDLPDFDFIALHGIWAWISLANQQAILEILSRHLKVGGLVYVSYNALPGWAPMIPVRQLMALHAKRGVAASEGAITRAKASFAFLERLNALDANYLRSQPGALDRIRKLSSSDFHYAVHEYFNEVWQPLPASEVIAAMEGVRLSYVGSAGLLDHLESLHLTAEERSLLADIADVPLRETTRDIMVNQAFRRDVYIKGPRVLTPRERDAAWREWSFVPLQPLQNAPKSVHGVLGVSTLRDEIYGPLWAALHEAGGRAVGFEALSQHAGLRSLSATMLREALLLLVAEGFVAPAHAPDETARARCTALNRLWLERAHTEGDVSVLSSPVAGVGVPLSRIPMLFVAAVQLGHIDATAIAEYVWDVLRAQGHRVLRDGAVLESVEENLAELRSQATEFLAHDLDRLCALQIAPTSVG